MFAHCPNYEILNTKPEEFRLILKKCTDQVSCHSLLFAAVSAGYGKAAKALYDAGVLWKDREEVCTLLQMALNCNDPKIIDALADLGFEFDDVPEGSENYLHIAAEKGNEVLVDALLTFGVNVNAKSEHRLTALHYASHGGHLATVNLLLSRGADEKDVAVLGRTPLHLAAHNGHVEVIGALIGAGATVNARDDNQRTPLAIAVQRKNERAAKLLKSKGGIL